MSSLSLGEFVSWGENEFAFLPFILKRLLFNKVLEVFSSVPESRVLISVPL